MKTSSLFKLDFYDIAKGTAVAVGGAVIAGIENTVQAGSLTINWKQIGLTALAAGLAYLTKNFFTPAQTITKAQ
ncbi:MAG: hypothetical protein ACTHNW_15390 [Mucilaginibacter sp.]